MTWFFCIVMLKGVLEVQVSRVQWTNWVRVLVLLVYMTWFVCIVLLKGVLEVRVSRVR